jgi:ATP-dependent Lon protease
MTEDLKNNKEFQLNEDPAPSEKEQSPQIKEIQNADSDSSNIELPATLPILPLRGLVVYPFTAVPLTVGQPRSIKLVDEVMSSDRLIGLIATKQQDIENPGPNDLYTIGTAATIHRMFRAPDGTIRLVIQGIARFKITEFIQQEPYLKAIIEPHPEINESSLEEEAIARNVRDQFQHIAEMIPSIPAELVGSITSIQDPLQTAYTIANFQRMDLEDGQNLLELDSSLEKLKTLVTILLRESEVLELGQKIQNEAREEIDKVQREYFLREQLKASQK